ncbi:MAG: DUF86 domain-containing protein [Actinobacteria bacterium]|nr:DUF86 domain-containing protein [Actinomycetota bacterium]
MRRSAKVLLTDAIDAAEAISAITAEIDSATFTASRLHRSSVERELLIIGEALNALDGICDDAGDRIPDLSKIIGMRNRLAHGYDTIDAEMIWAIAIHSMPALSVGLRSWLSDIV